MTVTAQRPSLDSLWHEQAVSRRKLAIDENRGERLAKGKRYVPPCGEKHHRAVYRDWQCTGVRASLEANKRVPFKGLSWNRIGALWGVPYPTVRKLASKQPGQNGKLYRPGSVPTEGKILYQVEQLKRLYKETQSLKHERKASRSQLRTDVINAGSIGAQANRSSQIAPVEQYFELCRAIGITPPKTLSELSDTACKLVPKANELGLTVEEIASLYKATQTYLESK